MGKASVNFRHEWVGRLLAVHYGCRISIVIILKQTSSEGPCGSNGSSFYYSSLAGAEDVISRAQGTRAGDRWLGRSSSSSPGSPRATPGQPGKDTEVNQGQQTKTSSNAPTTEASADQVLIKTFMHQHCCLNLPLPAPSSLSPPVMDTTSLEHFWQKMPFFCLIFSLTFAFWSFDEMWIWSYVGWLCTWREQRWCVWSHTSSDLVSPKAQLQPTQQLCYLSSFQGSTELSRNLPRYSSRDLGAVSWHENFHLYMQLHILQASTSSSLLNAGSSLDSDCQSTSAMTLIQFTTCWMEVSSL